MSSRRSKCHPTPPLLPSLQIPLLRRPPTNHHINPFLLLHRQHLSNAHYLFDKKTVDSKSKNLSIDRKGRVEEGELMFQAEILRAECNLLRMEKGFALKKLERNRLTMEKTFRSTVRALVSGKNKNVNEVLQKGIEDLSEKSHRSSRIKHTPFPKATHEFEKQERENKSCDVKMEEECGSSTANGFLNSSVSDSKDTVSPNLSSFSNGQALNLNNDNRCTGQCKEIIHRIVEQVKSETEQWSQMQEMLERVRWEMEELQASHDYWKRRTQDSNYEMQSLTHAVEEWKGEALSCEIKANGLEQKLFSLQEELKRSKTEPRSRQKNKGNRHCDENAKDLQTLSLGKQLAKEKRMLFRRINGKLHFNNKEFSSGGRRKQCSISSSSDAAAMVMRCAPLQDIGNSETLAT